jgi:hypothetical protein
LYQGKESIHSRPDPGKITAIHFSDLLGFRISLRSFVNEMDIFLRQSSEKADLSRYSPEENYSLVIIFIGFYSNISRAKTLELLVELWDSGGASERPPAVSCTEDNVSPVGHKFLGLCLVSVQDLMSTPSQTHVVSLQGRPFQNDSVINGTVALQVS